MFSMRLLSLAALVALVSGHAQLIGVQGIAGSPVSIGFDVDGVIDRNCTSISPCQLDSTIIRDAEIKAGLAEECGRTQLNGNIDVVKEIEDAVAAKAVTKVAAGGDVIVTLHQVNADGAGPYTCDVDQTGGTLKETGQTPVVVTNNVEGANGFSTVKTTDFNMTVTMPPDLKCTGGPNKNICVLRCRNNSLAGPFGGCVALEQDGAGDAGAASVKAGSKAGKANKSNN